MFSLHLCRVTAVVSFFVSLALPLRTAQPPIGVLTFATHAKLDKATAFAGLSVFDGERLSTEMPGTLGLRAGKSQVTLGEKTEIELIRMDAGGVHIDLEAGSVHFSSAENELIEVHTGEATIRPASAQPTRASLTLLGPKVLEINAERGDLAFSYRDEHRNLPAGQTYRVYLDADAPQPTPAGGAQTAPASGKLTYFIVGAAAGGAAGGMAWGIDHALHSSNPPISPMKP